LTTATRFVVLFGTLGCAATAFRANPNATGGGRVELSSTVEQMGPLKVGQPCPTFGGMTLDNRTVSLRKLLSPDEGPPVAAVVISFFASYCEPCKQHLPAIERAVATSKDVRGVLIDYGEKPEIVAPFVESHRLTLPVIADKFTKIAARLGVGRVLPRTVVVDRNGNVSAIFEREGDDFDSALPVAIEAVRNTR
jgi:peroxiredoxin